MSPSTRKGALNGQKNRTRLIAALGPPSVPRKAARCGPQIAVCTSRVAAARGLADSTQRCRLNSKSLANLLCTRAVVPHDARVRTVRHSGRGSEDAVIAEFATVL